MEPLFLAVIYGCQAGLLRDTLHEVYLPASNIQRGNACRAVKSARFLHKQPTPPSTSSGSPLFIFRVALLRRLLTSGLFAVS